MPAFLPLGEFKVEYLDGSTDHCKSNMGAVMEIERKWPSDDDNPRVEILNYGAWLYLGRPGDFDEWVWTVHLVEPVSSATNAKPTLDPSAPEAGPA